MKVAAIIPALNEEAAIGIVVKAIPRDVVTDVIVVDNGSSDHTTDVARAAGAIVVSQPERGYGAACMAGVAAAFAATADIVVFMDGDAADVPDRLADLVALIARGEAQLVLGVRDGDVERGAMLWHQRLGNKLVTAMIGRLSGRRLRDLPSLKAIDAATLRSLDLRERTHGWTAEMLTKAAFRGVCIAEMPTAYRRRIGVSKVSGSMKGSTLAAYRIVAAVIKVWRAERRDIVAATVTNEREGAEQ